MTPQQRMLAAIRREPVDRLAFATYNCHPFSWGEHAAWPEYAAVFDAIRQTGAGMLCKVRPGPTSDLPEPRIRRAVEGPEAVTTAILDTPRGPLRQTLRKPPGQPARCVEPYLKTDEDIEKFLAIEPVRRRPNVDDLLAHCREIGPAGLAYVDYADPFGQVASLFDQEDFLVRIHASPEPVMTLIEHAFRRIRESLHRLLELLAEQRPTVLLYTCGPELATPPLTSPQVFARMVTPYQSRLVSMIHEHDFPASLHCHGRVRQVLPEILECGFDVLEPIEPPPQGDIDLADLRRAAGDRMALMGYVQDQDLYTATPEAIRDHLAGIVEVVGAETGYVATPTCTPFDFPPGEGYVANYIAFLAAGAELGA